jgi:hypothetical protein
MKSLTLLFSVALLTIGCSHEQATSPKKEAKLLFEEYYTYDPSGSSSPDGFIQSYKLTYKYDQGKLIQVEAQDYNPSSHAYEASYLLEQYNYNNDGKLNEQIKFAGAVRWVYEYDYSSPQTKVTRYESLNGNFKLTDWWTIARTPSSLAIKYYQGNNELYAETAADLDEKGNVVRLSETPSLPVGKIYYTYDSSPNPYKFPELSGDYLNTEKYQSENNVIEVTNDSNTKSTRSISYNTNGYPISIITATSKKVLVYQ